MAHTDGGLVVAELRERTRLRHRQAGELHELVDGKGASAHELLVERGSGLGGEGLPRHSCQSVRPSVGKCQPLVPRMTNLERHYTV